MCVLLLASPVHGQTQHTLEGGREAIVGGLGVTLVGFGAWKAKHNADRPLSTAELPRLPGIDRVALRQWSLPAHRTSNALFGVSAAAALAVAVAGQRGEQPLLPVAIMAESGLLCTGLTNTAKELVRRPRPYLYNPDAPLHTGHGREDRVSFWSGHTANTAALTFSSASMVQWSNATQDQKTATWIGAAVAPAAMGYLRVRAGRHFPTDVLTGYAVGALVGLVVPYFHRTGTGSSGN